MRTKICTKCRIEKGLSEFGNKKNSHDGKRNQCKLCNNNYNKQYRKNNKEYFSDYSKKYREENNEYFIKKNKEYYDNNKDKINEKNKQWHKNNKQKACELKKNYYDDNIVTINNIRYNKNTCDIKLKPLINLFIMLKNKNKLIKELKK